MTDTNAEKGIYFGFWVSVVLKGAVSVIEVISGLIILFIPTSIITSILAFIVQSDLLGPSNSFVAQHAIQAVAAFTHDTQTFVAIYLLVRGVLKSGLLYGVARNKLWAYPATLLVFAGLVLFQLYQIVTTFSWTVIGITSFDLIVIFFIWREYRIVQRHDGVRKESFSTGTE